MSIDGIERFYQPTLVRYNVKTCNATICVCFRAIECEMKKKNTIKDVVRKNKLVF